MTVSSIGPPSGRWIEGEKANGREQALSESLRERRKQQITQIQLAHKIQSSQPRIALAEQGDYSVSFDLLLRAILATGATPQEIGQIISKTGR